MCILSPESVLDWVMALFLLCIVFAILRAMEWAWWRPKRLESALRQQGIRGNTYRFLFGDFRDFFSMRKEALSKPMPLCHDIVPRVLPSVLHTIRDHGKFSVTWFGPYPRVIVTNPELIREILSTKFGQFERSETVPATRLLLSGLLRYEGEKWAMRRRIINPAFHLEKLKFMLPAFSTCCSKLIERWEKLIGSEESVEVDVWPELQNLTGDVISQTAFGSNYEEGRRIFELQAEQAELLIQAFRTVIIPGYRFLPTKDNRRRKEIEREVRAVLRAIIEKRKITMKTGVSSDDLLSYILESNFKEMHENGKSKRMGMTTDDVIDECKLFYFAGQETTANLLTWTMIVLCMHPSWQQRAREEVSQIFGRNKPDFECLNHLKIVTMIIHEVLRLYPPAPILFRSNPKKVKLGEFTFPPGVEFLLPILLVHHDPDYWGPDVHEFKPERFVEGVSKAMKSQMAFFPFSGGPRVCIGQNFAMTEAKLALAMILQRFSFELSPSYTHAPRSVITLKPQHGAPIILHRL